MKLAFFIAMSSEWSINDVVAFMKRLPTHPGSLFLKRRDISAADAVALNLMENLVLLPTLPRRSYGPRQHKNSKEKSEDAKMRNKLHGKMTRFRRSIFKQCEHAVATRSPLPLPLPRPRPAAPFAATATPSASAPTSGSTSDSELCPRELFDGDLSDSFFTSSSSFSFSSFGCPFHGISSIDFQYKYGPVPPSLLVLPECDSLDSLTSALSIDTAALLAYDGDSDA